MPIITFGQITNILAVHASNELARQRPVALARRAVYELGSLLSDLTASERAVVVALIEDEILAPIAACEPAP